MTAPYWPPAMFYALADLSHWNPLPQDDLAAAFGAAAAYGIRYVALKATQGASFVDPTFAERRAAAAAAGLGVCAYAFLDGTDPAPQADWLLRTVGALGGIELAIDCESNPSRNGVDSVTIPIAEAVAQRLEERLGFPPIYYGSRWGPDGKATGLPSAALARCPLWLGEWGDAPVCPAGWAAWTMWQCTNGRVGRDVVAVPGLGLCDRSYIAAGSIAEIDLWWGQRASTAWARMP